MTDKSKWRHPNTDLLSRYLLGEIDLQYKDKYGLWFDTAVDIPKGEYREKPKERKPVIGDLVYCWDTQFNDKICGIYNDFIKRDDLQFYVNFTVWEHIKLHPKQIELDRLKEELK